MTLAVWGQPFQSAQSLQVSCETLEIVTRGVAVGRRSILRVGDVRRFTVGDDEEAEPDEPAPPPDSTWAKTESARKGDEAHGREIKERRTE